MDRLFKSLTTVSLVLVFGSLGFYGCSVQGPDEVRKTTDDLEQNVPKIPAKDEGGKKRPGSLPSRAIASALGLKLMSDASDGADPNRPDPGSSLDSEVHWDPEELTIDQNRIQIHPNIFLSDPSRGRKLFLVWPDNSLAFAVRDTQYTHRIQTKESQWIGDLTPRQVHRDRENHLWFIPVSDLFRFLPDYTEGDADATDSHFLTLNLFPEEGPNVEVEIQFQISGPLPVIRPNEQKLDPVAEPRSFVRRVSNQGWVIYREQFINPTQRSLNLWVRAEQRDLRLRSSLRQEHYKERKNKPPEGPLWTDYRSLGPLSMDRVIARHAGGERESQSVRTGDWVSFRLHPHDEITLHWVASAADGVRDCAVPGNRTEHYHWKTRPQTTYHWEPYSDLSEELIAAIQKVAAFAGPERRRVADPQKPLRSHVQANETQWWISHGVVEGAWQREVRLAEIYTPVERATREISEAPEVLPMNAPTDFRNLAGGTLNARVQTKEIRGDGPKINFKNPAGFKCQGRFR